MDDSAPYTMRERLRGVAISLTGLAVEFGWAVGESIMLPHLLAPPLSVAPAVAGLVFAINPVLSFGASPGDAAVNHSLQLFRSISHSSSSPPH